MENITERKEFDIYENREYFVSRTFTDKRELLNIPQILAITGLPYKKLQYHLWASGKYSSGATFDYFADKEVQSFHIYSY